MKDADVVLSAASNTKRLGETYVITEKEKKSFQEFSDLFKEQPEINKLITKIIETGSIEVEEAANLQKTVDEYKLCIDRKLLKESRDLSKKTDQLYVVCASKSKIKIGFLEERVEQCKQALALNESELAQFAVFKEKASIQLEIQQKIDLNKDAFESAENAVVDLLADMPKSKKGKEKAVPAPPFSKAIEVTYESSEGSKTVSIRTFDEALKAKNDITNAIEWWKKKQAGLMTDAPGDDDVATAGKGNGKKQQRKSEAAPLLKFTYHDAAGKECTSSVKNFAYLENINHSLGACKANLEGQKNEALGQLVRLKMTRDTSLEDLSQKFRRGSSNDVQLRGFDIEKMLESASEIASKLDSFHLSNENCSTTSMKLLQAGAPRDVGFMFDWHKLQNGETVASNMFLTNPQTVYSAGKLVERAGKGDTDARAMIAARSISTPERSYNRLLNELASSMVTYNDANISLPGKNFNNEAAPSKLSWSFYLKLIPYLFKLYRDIFQTIKLKWEEDSNTLEAQISRELKALNGKEYYIIDSISPALAINRLSEALKANKTNIPFFNTDTLSRVELYILSIQAKEVKTEEEKNALYNYKVLVNERDERVKCVENSLFSGNRVKEQLEKREVNTEKLAWVMTDKERIEALVDNFIYKYQEIRNKSSLSFLTSNFFSKLEATKSADMKLELINQQTQDYPEGRSAKALSACLSNDTVLQTSISLFKSPEIPSTESTTSFKARFHDAAESVTPNLILRTPPSFS